MKKLLLSTLAFAAVLGASAQNPSSLDYTNTGLNGAKAKAAFTALETALGQCKTGVYAMRGGKNGEQPGPHAYQAQYALDTDAYAQYSVVTHKDFPYSNNTHTTTYNISSFNGTAHGGYNLVKAVFPNFLVNPLTNDIPEIKAIYLLYYNLMAQENADLSGPFTYEEDKANSQDPRTYNSLKDVYYSIKADIDNIVACLNYYDEHRDAEYKKVVENYISAIETDGLACSELGKYDNFDGPRFTNFIRLANSLQLRMAMHLSKVEPATAKQWAEEAVSRGVIEQIDEQQGLLPSIIGFENPLVTIYGEWGDNRLSASFESLLMSLDHPYSKYLFLPNADPIENTKTGDVLDSEESLVGIRSGEFVGTGQASGSNPFINYSSLDTEVITSAPLYFISLKEVLFLRAEGALRGWNMGGTAEKFYEEGIRNAYLEDPVQMANGDVYSEYNYNDFIEDYLTVSEPIPYVQRDPQGLGEDWPSVTKIGVTWNEADALETKLEKIITQKYIALFPDSHEAWTELRRTGYPKLFPVLNANDGDGSILQGDMIRRIPYRITDPVQLGYWNATGLPALGGADLQATRLWWDVNCGNFEGQQDGINTVLRTPEYDNVTYTLDGRKAATYTKGIVIENGKKVIK